MNTICGSTVSACRTYFHSSGVKSVSCCSTSEHRACTKLHHRAASSYCRDLSRRLSHCCSFHFFVLHQPTLSLQLVHASFRTAI